MILSSIFRTASNSSNLPRIRRLAKEGSWIAIGQITSVLGALVLVRVLTERLDPTQYGQLALGLTVAGLVNQVVMGGITASIGRFYSIAAEKNDLTGYLRASRQLMVYATLAVVAIGLALMIGLLWLGYSQCMGLAAAVLVFSMLSGYNAMLNGIQNAARHRGIVAFCGGMDAWLKIFFALGVLLWLGNSSTAVVIGYMCSSLIVTCSQLFFLRRLIAHRSMPASDSGQWIRQMWAFSWPFAAWGVFTWALTASDRWALQMFVSTQDVGLYAVLFQLGYYPISLLSGLMAQLVAPIFFQRAGDATNESRMRRIYAINWQITMMTLILTGIATMLAFVFHGYIFKWLVAPEYRDISWLLPGMVLAGGLFATGQFASLYLMSEKKSVSLISPKVVTAVAGVLLNVAGARLYGIAGLVAAMVTFSGLYFLWIYFLAQGRQKAV